MDGIKGGFRTIDACALSDGSRKKRKPRTTTPVWLTGSKRLKRQALMNIKEEHDAGFIYGLTPT